MPLLWLSLAWLAGIALANWLALPWYAWATLCLAGILGAVLEKRRQRVFAAPAWRVSLAVAPGLLLTLLALGGLRYQWAERPFTARQLAYYNDGAPVILTGVINAPQDVRDDEIRLQVRVQEIVAEGEFIKAQKSQLLAVMPAGGTWHYGDEIQLSGTPLTPFESEAFSYRAYLARTGTDSILYYPQIVLLQSGQGNPLMRVIFALRDKAHAVLRAIFPQPEAALLMGILLGNDHEIPDSLQNAFRDTGTAHIIAISGFNMTILAGLFMNIFQRITRKPAASLFAAAALIFYTLLVGASPAVVRAAIMAVMGLIGRLIGRRQSGSTSLSFTAAVMCLFNPLLLWDASFQLSFTATLGLVLYADPLQAGFTRWAERRYSPHTARRLAGPVGEYLLFTLAAQITTLPVVAYHFQRISLSTLLANPLVLPVQPPVMVLSGLALIGGLIWLPIGKILAWLALPLTTYTIRMAEWLAQLPSSVLVLNGFPAWMVLLYYLALFGFTLSGQIFVPLQRSRRPALILLAGGLICAGLMRSALAAPDGYLHISLAGIPSADCLYLQTPSGSRILVNGAPSASELNNFLGRRLPPFDHHLDAVILAGQSKSQLEGLPAVLERFPASQAAWAGPAAEGRNTRRLNTVWQTQGISAAEIPTRSTLQLDESVTLQVLAAPDSERAALLLRYGTLRVLIPGGVSLQELLEIDTGVRQPGVLILNSEDLVNTSATYWNEEIQPQVVFLQADLPNLPTSWQSTALHGWLHIRSDGGQMWIESQR